MVHTLSRKPVLTEAQKKIIAANVDMFPADIKRIPGLAEDDAVTRPIINNYLKTCKKECERTDEEELAEVLTRYISTHGLPSRYHGKNNVTGFLEYLRK